MGNALYLYGGLGIRILATLALIPLLGRTLGPVAFGVFAVANTVALVVWQLVEYGIPLVASRRYARATEQRERDASLTVATFGRLALTPLALAVGVAVIVFSPVLDEAHGVGLLACVLGVQSGMNFGWLLTAIGAARVQALLETLPAVVTLVLCLLLVATPQDLGMVFLVMNVAALLANTLGWIYARRHAHHRKPSGGEILRALRGGHAVFLYRVALIGISSGSAYVLGYFVSGHEVGNYALADRLLSAAAGLLQPLAVVAFPGSMRMFATQPARAAKLYSIFIVKVVAVSLLAALLVHAVGPSLVPWAMGPKYEQSIPYLMALIWALPIMAVSQMVVSCVLYPLHRDVAIGVVYALGITTLGAAAHWWLPAQGAAAMVEIRLGVEALMALALCGIAVHALRSAPADHEASQ